MTLLYLDPSVVVALFANEVGSEAAAQFMARENGPFLLSDFAVVEIASAFSRLVRTRRRTVAEAYALLSAFDTWRAALVTSVAASGPDIAASDRMVRRFDLMLKAPDGLHVAAAQRLGATLVTFDTRLATAARALGVEVETPA